jgi:hypothetical protein
MLLALGVFAAAHVIPRRNVPGQTREAVAIELTDLKLHYVPIAEARRMSGLRIVLGAYPIPGPWRESCKGVFYVKGLKQPLPRTRSPFPGYASPGHLSGP